MNFLGHLYFSNDDPEIMLLNLYGDFIKGSTRKIKHSKLKKAVILHREIDDFIDNHKDVYELKMELYKDLPKVAGIAIDLYFDHLLAKNWSHYHPSPLEFYLKDFFDKAFNRINDFENKNEITFTPLFKMLLERISNENWILNYRNLEGLKFACTGLSRRISFENNLNEGDLIFEKHQKTIETVFEIYMESAQQKFLFKNT